MTDAIIVLYKSGNGAKEIKHVRAHILIGACLVGLFRCDGSVAAGILKTSSTSYF
jgi:hypothetical protein